MQKSIPKTRRDRQIRKEVQASLGLYLAFFLWWYFTGYGIAEQGSPETYTYIAGLPMWFFLSSIVGYLLFCIASVILIKVIFKDFDLGAEAGSKEEGK